MCEIASVGRAFVGAWDDQEVWESRVERMSEVQIYCRTLMKRPIAVKANRFQDRLPGERLDCRWEIL
jgi:hypothetical protein